MKKLESAVYVSWEESERGWGVRPNGCSLHLANEDYTVFLRNYWDKQSDEVPDEYSRPASKPTGVIVSKSLYDRIKKSELEKGIWIGQVEQKELEKSKDLRFSGKRTGLVPVK